MSLSQRKDQLNSTEPKSGATVKAAEPLALHCGGIVTSVNRTSLIYQVKNSVVCVKVHVTVVEERDVKAKRVECNQDVNKLSISSQSC